MYWYGKKRAILPQKPDLSDLPQLVVKKFAECLTIPGEGISWEQLLPLVIGFGPTYFGFIGYEWIIVV